MANQDVDYHALDLKASNGASGRDFEYQLPNQSSSGVESAVDDLLTAIDDPESRAPAPMPPPSRPASPPPQIRQTPIPATPAQMTNAMPAPQPAQVKQPSAAQLARGAHLYAGHGLKLKGEISDCETFTVEGDVEAHLSAKQLLLASSGTFRGSAIVEEAQIEGAFEGELHVTGRLLLRSSGRAAGTISYGMIEIERGGQLHGHIAPYVQPQPQPASAPKVAQTQAPPIIQRVVEQQPARRPEPARASAYQPPPTPRVEAKPAEPPKPAPETKKRSTFFGGFRPTTP